MEPRPEDLAATLVRRARQQQARADERLADARAAVETELARCPADGTVRRAWLIGSAAWGEAHGRSDVDVVVEGLDTRRTGALWDRLSQACGFDVDLLSLEDLPSSFQERVRSDGVEIHGR